jgi:hypothetical protein
MTISFTIVRRGADAPLLLVVGRDTRSGSTRLAPSIVEVQRLFPASVSERTAHCRPTPTPCPSPPEGGQSHMTDVPTLSSEATYPRPLRFAEAMNGCRHARPLRRAKRSRECRASIPERFKVIGPQPEQEIPCPSGFRWLAGMQAMQGVARALPSQVPEWMPDTLGFASLAGEVEHDDISLDASANLPGQRQADCGRKANAIAPPEGGDRRRRACLLPWRSAP